MPHWVEEQLLAIAHRWPLIKNVHLHLHDARGRGAARAIYAALRASDDSFTVQLDVVAGAVGAYWVTVGATGMAATEDVVPTCSRRWGIPTGVDLDRLIDAVWLLE